MPENTVLHGFWRSSSAWRVRIALALKGVAWEGRTYHLREGRQRGSDFLALNPQGLVPALEIDGATLTQSLAMCEYLDEVHPEPALLPGDAMQRAKIRAAAQAIACDVHPLQNLKVLQKLRDLGHSEDVVTGWARDVIEGGLEAFSKLIARNEGTYCFGDTVTLADICLIPQLGNARRFGARMDFPRLLAVEAACNELEAFRVSVPSLQSDAE
ncbi:MULTISPECIES: maleylacetoacetate isomerase [unclassified Novosphingobium]|uniref:maleylacetoacetate isomerase n=1 Tax=unclassified Novosphingobium TaxID=2644732 RepID=UPI00020EE743|nr:MULTISPECIES: maleylacetoacetate isomerase [unclassified Novosphingobium]GFM27963.1 maleylacetoacetate isomerase [Novosphingobium sp. PY1]CCA91132.1 maleylacetoacetate isomerase [Novosphingobium sp. PP1Y]